MAKRNIDQASVDAAYQALTPPDARHLAGTLGVHPGQTVSAELAATLTGVDRPQARHLLDAIAAHELITDDGDGWYRFPPGVHAYLQDASENTESANSRANGFLVDIHWYIAVAQRISAIILPSRPAWGWTSPPAGGLVVEPADFRTPGHALAWMDREHRNAAAVVAAAVMRGLPDEALWLVDALQSYFLVRECDAEAVEVDQLALEAAVGDDDRTIPIRGRASRRYARLGDRTRARLHLDWLHDLVRDDSDPTHLADLLHAQGVFLAATGHAAIATEPLWEAAALRGSAGDVHGEALTLYEVGTVLLGDDQHDRAVMAFDRAHDLLSGPEIVDRYFRARIDIAGANARLRRRETLGVHLILDDARLTMAQWGDRREEARAYDALADLANLLRREKAAIYHRAQAAALRRPTSAPSEPARP